MAKKILIFQSNKASYSSYISFAAHCLQAFEKLGYDVVNYDLAEGNPADLKELLKDNYKLVLDFNSNLPETTLDDMPILELINGPVFDWLLDHPIYHHKNLRKVREKDNFHVICLDEEHVTYVKENYPNVKSVKFLPVIGGDVPEDKMVPFIQKSNDVAFFGTYTDPDEMKRMVSELPTDVREPNEWVLDLLTRDHNITFYRACRAYLDEHKDSHLNNIPFASYAHMVFWADMIARSEYREKVLKSVLSSGMPLHLYGADWNKFASKTGVEIGEDQLHPPVSYDDSVWMQGKHKVVLNAMPWFKSGLHDRVFSVMRSGSLLLTDGSKLINSWFRSGYEFVEYKHDKIDEIPQLIQDIFTGSNPDIDAENIAAAGYEAVKSYSWTRFLGELLDSIN